MEITRAQVTALRKRSKGSWKYEIASYLKEHQGTDDITLFDQTRLDSSDWTDKQKKNNIASQYSYLRDEGYIVVKDNDKYYLVTEPKSGKGDIFVVIPGQESRVQAALNIKPDK